MTADQNVPRGWWRDDAGVAHEMIGAVDPSTGLTKWPRTPFAAIYSMSPGGLIWANREEPDVIAPASVAEPKTLQDLLDDYFSAAYNCGEWGYPDDKQYPHKATAQAILDLFSSLHAEIARLKDGLQKVAEVFKELEAMES